MKQPNVAICMPCYDKPTFHTWISLDQLAVPRPGTPVEGSAVLHRLPGIETATARKQLTLMALKDPSVTHILWVDADMAFPPDALLRLLAHDKDIVGGLCHARRGPSFHPIAAKRFPSALGLPESARGFMYDLPKSGLVEVDATGAAFLLVKREVFEKVGGECAVRSGHFDNWWTPIGDISEDFSFCERAQYAGFKIWIDCGLDIGHVGEVNITRDVAERLRTTDWARWTPLGEKPADGKPVATIIIPTYNQKPAYLKAAVLSALNQTVPTEVIVVDDGTTDYNLRVGEVSLAMLDEADSAGRKNVWISSRAKLIRHDTNRGISAALNTGIGFMSTDWFCWLSSDDLFEPNKVEAQLNATLAAGAKASFHDYAVIDNEPGAFARYAQGRGWNSIEEQMASLREGCCINGSTTMIHASVFEAFPEDAKMGRFFDPALRYGQDWDAWAKIGQKFLWHHIPKSLGTRREGQNLTARIAASTENDPARLRRDEEDRIVRERYAKRDPAAILRAFADVYENRDGQTQFVAGIRAAADRLDEECSPESF